MIAGEMLNWSDLHPEDGEPATGGQVPSALLDAVLRPDDKVLAAGPHSLEVLALIAGRVTSVDVLVRSAPDAEEIADQLEGHPLRVFCGSLDHFGPEHGESSYDVVVALDGLPRLVGPDTIVLTWADALAALKTRLAPEGRLLVAAANPFGVERLVLPGVTATVPSDEAWPRDIRGSVEAPAGLKAVQAALGDAATAYAVYPSLVDAKVALVDASDSLAGVVAARAVAERYPDLTLMDPYRVVQDAFAAGLGAELAPGWYFAVGTDLPTVLGEVPQGPGVLLEETLLAALKIDDHAALRRTVPGYVTWLRSLDADAAAVASPDNVLADGTAYKVFGGSEGIAGSGDALVVGQLARFVRRSLEAASRQPWASGGDARDLTARLAAMAGITVTEELWASVADGNEPVTPTGYAEQLATIVRLSEELADASAQASWFESQLDGIRRSRPYRIGQAVLNPARVVVKRVRRTTGR
ncbi:hypothetical protein F1D05_23140 [Kribbella qitaiheensis]|uniref:Class I SAM-dependent methyltransferase n=2 Tax=Kribbella qitaiheensis TaxID=1544730 RepID=A0A7G6XA34_9ACTN|nr:hypothetical protein F1D05_23140 [Kribbella qitaiheensis]